MAKFTYNERFTNVKKYDDFSKSYTGIKIASKLNQKNGEDYKLLDVTDLDWQGAWLATAGAYINDTYELLEAIDNIADLAELQWVKDKINELDVDVNNIINLLPSYVTKEEFDLIISQQQRALIPGAYISIDSDTNIISAYDLLSVQDAANIYTTKEQFNELDQYIQENYYEKWETDNVAKETAYAYIRNYVVKNADKKYDDLEKISDWILSQSKYVPVDYGDIDTDSDKIYYIYDESTGQYIQVDEEFIINHPDEDYYVELQIADDLAQLNRRVDNLEETVGYYYYDTTSNSYTYTGLLHDIDRAKEDINILFDDVEHISDLSTYAYSISILSYNTAVESYDMAYFAYEMSLLSDAYAYLAYVMAYDAQEKIGIESVDGYYRPLNEEELEILTNDKFAIPVFSKQDPNDEYYRRETYFDLDKYNNGELYYYVYVDPVESTGFYKKLEEYDEAIKYAQYSADNALFNLGAQTNGTSYAYVDLTPDVNEGDNTRTIVLNVTEADVSYDTGEILRHGFITTYSLFNSLAYYSRFEILPSGADNSLIDP